MAHRVDGRTEDQVFHTPVAMRSHNHEVRLQILDGSGDLLSRVLSMPNYHLNAHLLIAERADEMSPVVLTFGNFRRR